MKHATLVTSADLLAWADRSDAVGSLPRLIRRLVHATGNSVSHVGFPADEGVRAPGYDGIVVVGQESNPVPASTSVWELSVRKDVVVKANQDYAKRVADSGDVTPASTTYVAVTLRRWPGKSEWAAERQAEGHWKTVLALDVDDLETWLERCPAVHLWLSAMLGKRPDGILDLETYWADWSAGTEPPTSPDLVLAGREKGRDAIVAFVQAPTQLLSLRAESREEAVAVFAASIMSMDAEARVDVLARTLVVRSEEALYAIASEQAALVLIPAPSAELGDGAVHAQRKGHHLLVPLGSADPRSPGSQIVPRLSPEAAAEVLARQGMKKDRARELALLARRSLLAFRRALAALSSVRQPAWSRPAEAPKLIPMLLAGRWRDSSPGDQEVLATLAGKPYSEVADCVRRWAHEDDPPFRRVGDTWYLLSREDAWATLSRMLARVELERLAAESERVLGTPNPKFSLPDDEQWWAAAKGAVPATSVELTVALAETVAMLGARGSEVEVATGTTAEDLAKGIVRRLLELANTNWHIWASLSDWGALPLLAEAAPDNFMSAVDQGTRGDAPVLKDLFRDNSGRDPMFSSSPHTGVLWALETLAWAPELLSNAALLLASLASMDPGGRLSNRPLNSLRSIFLSWYPQTSASIDGRFAAIDAIRRRQPEVAWKLLCALLPESHSAATPTATPRWRDWGSDGYESLSRGEVARVIDGVVQRVVQDVGKDGERWATLIGALGSFSPEHHRVIVDTLKALKEDELSELQRAGIWHALREEVSRHRSFATADWALPTAQIDEVAGLMTRFEPRATAGRFAWVFQQWPQLPEGLEQDHDAHAEAVANAQRQSVRQILASPGISAIVGLIPSVKAPFTLGFALGEELADDTSEEPSLLVHLASEDVPHSQFARGFVSGRAKKCGPEWVKSRVADTSSSLLPVQRADMLLSLPAEPETWELAAGLGPDGDRKYWSRINVYMIPLAHTAEGLRKLLEYGQAFAAVDLLGRKPDQASAEQIMSVMDAVLLATPAPGDINQLFSYHLGEFFKRLEGLAGVDPSRVAKLEWNFLPVFDRHEHRPRFLHRELARDPKFFVEVLSLVYRGEHDEPKDLSEDDRARWRNANALLDSWRTPPGVKDDGSVDSATMLAWVEEARRECAAKDRRAIGDQVVGQILSGAPAEPDRVWPAMALRDVIEAVASPELETGIALGRYNGRGVVSKGIYEGGDQESALAAGYEAAATSMSAHHPRTAAMLRRMAEDYRRDARRGDQHSEERRDFEP